MTEVITIQYYDEVYIKLRADSGIIHELNDHFTFSVPGAKFSPAYRNGVWDGKIRLLNIMSGLIYAGLVPYIQQFASERDYEITFDGKFTDREFSLNEAKSFISKLNLPHEVRDYQLEAFTHAVRKRRALLLSPTASGKSLIIYLLARFYNRKTLIIVPTTTLVHQMASDFTSYGYTEDCHRITAGVTKECREMITVSTWQSIVKLPKQWFNQFDVVIGDEAHLFKAKSLTTIMGKLQVCRYRFGFTGTLDGSQTNKLVLEGLFGAVKRVTSTSELIEQKHLAEFKIKAIVLSYPEELRKKIIKMTYQEEIDSIVRIPARNKFIKNLALSLEGNTIIMFQFVEKHGEVMHKMFMDAECDRNIYYVAGKTETEEREEIRKIIETETNAIILASSVFSTGINIKNLHNIIFSSPSKSRIRNLQSIGRVLRKTKDDEPATLYDIADDLSWKSRQNFTLQHFKERIKIYSDESFPFKIYSVGLNA